MIDPSFFIAPEELALRFTHRPGARRLAFAQSRLPYAEWRERCTGKLRELLGLAEPTPGTVQELRHTVYEGVTLTALVMRLDDNLSLPAYLLAPHDGADDAHRLATRHGQLPARFRGAIMAIHGHGEVEPSLGLRDDYHHRFAFALAQAGYLVLCPELRGFGALRDLSCQREGYRLDYWNWGQHMAYSLVTDGFLHGHTLIGETVEDLLRWEDWLGHEWEIEHLDVVGISYGGDLALTYPVFSRRVARIWASGTLGSFEPIFARCYNAPAHCIPGVLEWMDRADIAGLNAPRPIVLHYGELDTPGDGNYSASYNETVPDSLAALRSIYTAAEAQGNVRLVVSPGRRHEMDNAALLAFLAEG